MCEKKTPEPLAGELFTSSDFLYVMCEKNGKGKSINMYFLKEIIGTWMKFY